MTVKIMPSTAVPTPTQQPAELRPAMSVIVPLYNEEESIDALIENLLKEAPNWGRSFEILLVDDGSTDDTAARIRAAEAHREVKGIFLARNYGQSTALQAGFDHSRGGIVVTLDGDLQNDPADIKRLLDVMREQRVQLVSGWRKDRKDDPLRVLLSKAANWLISRITGVRLHDYGCTLKAYDRTALRSTRIYGEMHRFLPAVMSEVGAKIQEIEVTHHPRRYGRSKYGLDRTLRVVLDILLVRFLLRHMHRPLHLFGSLGVLSFGSGFLISLYLTYTKLVLGESLASRPLLTLGVFLMVCGVILLTQGILAELLIRILHEPKGRQQYLLQDEFNDIEDSRHDEGA